MLSIIQAAQLIREADSFVIVAGASMSIDSGLLDFRYGNNFWNTFPELQGLQHGFLGLATERNFTYRSELAWGFYGHCLRLYRAAVPHAGYALLKKWGERMPLGYGVFTSNVDGQFQKAGFDEARIVESRGSIHHLQCIHCCKKAVWSAADFEPKLTQGLCHMDSNDFPLCPHVGCVCGFARPNVLMPFDGLWVSQRSDAQLSRLDGWLKTTQSPIVIELGGDSDVGRFAAQVQANKNASLIRIHPHDCEVSGSRSVSLPMGALAGLMAIETALVALGLG